MSTTVEDDSELLRRQVIEVWTAPDGTPLSVAFAPTQKDKRRLSTDRERIEVAASFKGYADRTGNEPHSTWPMCVGVVRSLHTVVSGKSFDPLYVEDDGGEDGLHDGHASVVFPEQPSPSAERRVYERIRKTLRDDALARGRLYPAA